MINTCLCFFVSVVLSSAEITFVSTSSENNVLTGYLWEGSKSVYFRPRLQILSTETKDQSNSICGIRIFPLSGGNSPFYAVVTDQKNGFADLIVNSSVSAINADTLYSLDAYDCREPPSFSDRVTIRIHVIAGGGPFFPQPSYTFTISRRSYADTFVGQVQAISQPTEGNDGMYSAVCSYQLSPPDTPFAIDPRGVIRIKRELEIRPSGRPYMLQVTAEDCQRPTPRRATVDVIIRQIADGCQAGWTGLPTYLEYRGSANRPEKLLKPYDIGLEFCVSVCDLPEITARLELQSAVNGHTLEIASSQACLHDPEQLVAQQIRCGIHPTTLNNFLPNPDQSIASQFSSSLISGNPPKLLAPSVVWRFNASSQSVWQVDRSFLNAPEHSNAFDIDFTVSFWLRRNVGLWASGEEEESIVCSQDRQEPNWRFMSIGLKKCQLIVRLLSQLQPQPGGVDTEPRKASVWTFGSLPIEGCSESQEGAAQWHHYAVVFNRNPWATNSEPVSLLVDGRDVGAPEETQLPGLPPFRPMDKKADPIITVGACYDPETRLTKEHANADLAGLAVLTERAEAMSNLRCVAQCGESLIVPNVMKYLKSDVTVDLETRAITVTAQNVSHIVDILQAVAYIRPQVGVSRGYSPNAIQSRLLNLTTSFSCASVVEMPSHVIHLDIFPETPASTTDSIQLANKVEQRPTSGTSWIPEQAADFSRSPISQRDAENKAWAASKRLMLNGLPPPLLIAGSDILFTEPPVRDPGVQVFSDIRFVLPEEAQNQDTITASAAVPLDMCLVWIESAGISSIATKDSTNHSGIGDGHLEWSLKEIANSGLSSVMEQHGIEFRGQKPAGTYEKVLKTIHYWPPRSVLDWNADIENQTASPVLTRDVRFSAKIGLVCSSEAGKKITPQFFVNIVVESADVVLTDLASEDTIRNLAPDENLMPVSYAHSQRERQSVKSPRLLVRSAENEMDGNQSSQHPSANNRYIAIGLSVTAVLLIMAISLAIALYVRRGGNHKPTRKPSRRRRFPAQPADFGGSSLKRDPTLRLTANPMGELEYSGIGVVSEDLYGSCKNIAPTRNIFSPPLPESQRHSLWPNARLAGFDDFDEDYVDELSDEQPFTEANADPAEERVNHSQTENTVDVHDWIDEDDSREASSCVPESGSGAKCNLVVTSIQKEARSVISDL